MTNEVNFHLEGEFLGVCALDGYKLKYLRIRTADSPQEIRHRDVIIKVPKELRMGLVYQLAIGDRLRCEGIQKDGKLKASTIEKVVCEVSPGEHRTPPLARSLTASTEHKLKVKILICQKSHCHNNGGKEIYSALAAQLDSHDLNESVTLKSTGCLKFCKQAPNLVVLPVATSAASAKASPLGNQSSHQNVRIFQIPAIIATVRHHLSIEPK